MNNMMKLRAKAFTKGNNEENSRDGNLLLIDEKSKASKRLFKIKYEDLVLKEHIAAGQGGVVYQGEWLGLPIAFKSFPTSSEMEKTTFKEFETESEVYLKFKNPNLLKLYGFCLQPKHLGLVTELCPYGDLQDFLMKNTILKDVEKVEILYGICLGMRELHKHNIIHRDLKLRNVLIGSKLIPKVMDFGLSKVISRMSVSKTMNVGTLGFQAPEIRTVSSKGRYTEIVDVYSFGIIAYRVLCFTVDDFKNEMFNKKGFEIEKKKLKKIKFPWMVNIITTSLEEDPANRKGFDEIIKIIQKETGWTDNHFKDILKGDEKMKKQKEPIVLYLKSGDGDFEDFVFQGCTLKELEMFVKNKLLKKNVDSMKIYDVTDDSNKVLISNDKIVDELEEDSMLEIEI